jgi:hypothetical protein
MKTKTHLALHLAGLDDYAMGVAAYWATVKSRPEVIVQERQ